MYHAKTRKSIHTRFIQYTTKNNPDYPNCHIWTACKEASFIGKDYGMMSVKRYNFRTHRVAWMFHNKKTIPKDMQIRHGKGCNTLCCNPEHLTIGTHQQNTDDRVRDGTQKYGEDHHASTITDETAILIRDSQGDGTTKERALRFNTTSAIVSSIDCGHSHQAICASTPRLNKKIKSHQSSSVSDEIAILIRDSKGKGTQKERAERYNTRKNVVVSIDTGKTHRALFERTPPTQKEKCVYVRVMNST